MSNYTPEQLREWADWYADGDPLSNQPQDSRDPMRPELILYHAAALEENAKLRKHAEYLHDRLIRHATSKVRIEADIQVCNAYRADFPKKESRDDA